MSLDIVMEDLRWQTVGLDVLAARAEAATCARLGLDPDMVEASLLACDDARIAVLNTRFRGKPAPTNVLSWPAVDLSPGVPGRDPHPPEPDPGGEIALGDIAIAYETCAREAAESGKALADHATHLVVHGLLHLLGYDHESDADAALMEGLEIEVLGRLGLDDPYRNAERA